MNTIKTYKDRVERLAHWIRSLAKDAENDLNFYASWYACDISNRFSIVGGWLKGFSEDYSTVLYTSKSHPEYAMCIKIVDCDKGCAPDTDFADLVMPIGLDGQVEDTCIAIERDERN